MAGLYDLLAKYMNGAVDGAQTGAIRQNNMDKLAGYRPPQNEQSWRRGANHGAGADMSPLPPKEPTEQFDPIDLSPPPEKNKFLEHLFASGQNMPGGVEASSDTMDPSMALFRPSSGGTDAYNALEDGSGVYMDQGLSSEQQAGIAALFNMFKNPPEEDQKPMAKIAQVMMSRRGGV